MNWDEESWIKLYTRDTATWMGLTWQGRTVLLHLFRKARRSDGVVDLGEDILGDLAGLLLLPLEVVEPGVANLLKRKCIAFECTNLVIPNFPEAQTARTSDRLRQQLQREKARPVTPRHTPSHAVTSSHDQIRREEIRKEEIKDSPPRKRSRPPAGPKVEGHQEVVDTFSRCYEQARKTKPLIGSKTGKAAKTLLSMMPAQEACSTIEAAFADPWFVRNRGELEHIAAEPNMYRGVRDPPSATRLKPIVQAVPVTGPLWEMGEVIG